MKYIYTQNENKKLITYTLISVTWRRIVLKDGYLISWKVPIHRRQQFMYLFF